MNNTIEILDKDTNTKQTYVLKEKQEKKEIDLTIVIAIFKGSIKILRFSVYIAISFLKFFIKIVEKIFNLNEDYRPLKKFSNGTNSILNKIADRNIRQERMRFATQQLTKHTYEFERSDLFVATYKHIQSKLKDFADNNVAINYDIYRDILQNIDVITVECERKALVEGYSFASYTKYKLSDDEVYPDYIQYKIMRGEGHGKVSKKQGDSTD